MRFERKQEFPLKGGIISWMADNYKSEFKIDRSTKIASIGSCFAREIKNWLIENKFNYLIAENNNVPWESSKIFTGDKGKQPYEHASVAWERVYNTFTLAHIIDYTFNENWINKRLVKVNIKGHTYISDIIRNRIIYKDMVTAQADIVSHIAYSNDILCAADLFIITLGLTEIWISDERKLVAAANPHRHYSLPGDFHFMKSNYEDNLCNLYYVYDQLKKHNEKIKILITVSPVGLLETFRNDVDVITANCESKSILRAVAGTFSQKKDVYYFPSYEIATSAGIVDGIKMSSDGHHVSKELINAIMNVFKKSYVLN